MSEDHVLYAKEDGIGIVTLNRPEKMNAITFPMLNKMGEIIKEIKSDESVRAVVLTANGRAFSAGTDISDNVQPDVEEIVAGIKERNSTDAPQSSWMFTSIAKPVICAINGVAVGVGSELALQCDIRIAAESARFGQVFVLRGIVPDTAAGTYLLPRLTGPSVRYPHCRRIRPIRPGVCPARHCPGYGGGHLSAATTDRNCQCL